MKTTQMLTDIQGQPDSLRQVFAHQIGVGAGELRGAAALLGSAHRIIFTGMGSSLSCAVPAARHLMAHGVCAEVLETSELLYFGLETIDSATVVVLISRSGETVEAVRVLPQLLERGASVIGITNVPGSTIARKATCTIFINSLPDRMVAVQTYSASLAVILFLADAALGRPLDAWSALFEETCALVATTIQSSIAESEDWVEFLSSTKMVYLLGRGPSMASALEGALMFNEAARLPSSALSTAHFRHGPVEIVDSTLRAIVFASQAATRNLDFALATELQTMGAGVRVCEAPSSVAPFQPLVEIVPVQIAVCALAISKNIDPGAFRFATLVTATESGFQGPAARG